MPKSKIIPMKSLAQYRHVRFLMTIEKQAIVAYRLVMLKMTNEIITKKLKKGKLAKSEPLEKGLNGDWQKEGYTLSVLPNDQEDSSVYIKAYAPDKSEAGWYHFDHDKASNTLTPLDSRTDFRHERKGLATAAYRHAEKATGAKAVRGEVQSAKAKKLWSQPTRPFGKSEDKVEGLESGWSEEVPQLEVDLEALTGNVLDKYMDVLRWILMGDLAGKEAAAKAKSLGLKGKVVPGVVHAAYLSSIDAHSEHFQEVTGNPAPEMPVTLIKASFDQIAKRVNRFIDATVSQLRTDVLNAMDRSIVEHNFKALNSAHEEAHDLLPSLGADEAATEAGEAVSAPLAAKAVRAELEAATEKFEAKWDLAVRSDLAMASAAGTHQALLEIHGKDNPNVKVAWIEIEDERVCSFCKKASKNPDGSHKLYSMSDFQPSGYNYIRKKADWAISIPPAHPRCRCALVYIPPGFEVDDGGGIRAKPKS